MLYNNHAFNTMSFGFCNFDNSKASEMKHKLIILNLIILYSLPLLSQQTNQPIYYKQDSIYFKKVNSPIKKQSQNDTLAFNYSFYFKNHKIGVKTFERETNNVIDSFVAQETWWEDTIDEYSIVNTGHRKLNKRTYIYAGLETTNIADEGTGESNTYPSFYCFEIDSLNKISFFQFIQNKFSQFISNYYAIGHTYYWSGGGFTWDCTNYYTYKFSDTEILTPNYYANCEGYPLFFIDSIFNNLGHLFSYVHPDVRIYSISFISYDLEPLWHIENSPLIYTNHCITTSLNGKINYAVAIAPYYINDLSSETLGPMAFILDLNEGRFIDTLKINKDFVELFLHNRIPYFKTNLNEYYIIDHLKYLTDTIVLETNYAQGDTIGRVCNTNIFGNNLRFISNSNAFKIDSLIGTITIKNTSSHYPNVHCTITDQFDTIEHTINIKYPVNVINKQRIFKVFPNPCNDKIYITNTDSNEKFNAIIYDIKGNIVLENKSVSKININKFSSGIYILGVEFNFMYEYHKIVISH